MSKVHIATGNIYNSETGELFTRGDVIPDTEENAVLLEGKVRRGRKVVPGVEDGDRNFETKIAGSDRAKPGAGQSGSKPAKRPAKAASETTAAAVAASDEDAVDIVIGGKTRVTPTGGKVQDVDAETGTAATGSALD